MSNDYFEKDGKKFDKKTGERIIKQGGKTYRENFWGKWEPDKDFLGEDKIERDILGSLRIERDIFGDEKIEKDIFGNPIIPSENTGNKATPPRPQVSRTGTGYGYGQQTGGDGCGCTILGIIILLIILFYARDTLGVSNLFNSLSNTSNTYNSTKILSTTNPTKSTEMVQTEEPKQLVRISNQVEEVNLRRSPGYSNKSNIVDVIIKVPTGAYVQIIGGPEIADGLQWWYVSWNGYEGWMADHTGKGRVILEFDP
ncbi:MAG: hypothetical protein CNIPEHKO_01599 [Anaerolineales bacterium]|nr:hypothetical protein [Anaerolineales bacterium]